MAEVRLLTLHGAQQQPGRLGEARLVVVEKIGAHHVYGGDDVALAATDLYAVLAAESLGAADVAIVAHVHDRLLIGINAQATEIEEVVVHGRVSDSLR